MSKEKQLTEGVVGEARVFAERVKQDVTKIMKVVSIARTARTLIMRAELQTKHTTYALEIDEATVRAMVKVFDDFRASGQAAPPPPPERPWANEGKPVPVVD